MKIAVASDHGGVDAKREVITVLRERGIEALDLGCRDTAAVDYPDYSHMVVSAMANHEADEGILICKSGIGMSISANKYPGIRAALCLTPDMAFLARTHNDANVLVLGGQNMTPAQLRDVLNAWISNRFAGDGRHVRRLKKSAQYAEEAADVASLCETDPVICGAVRQEVEHAKKTINLIASENYASRAVRQAQGSVMTNKYAEGYPGKRYYNGCDYVDMAESTAIRRANALFGSEHANVQPHCGSSANMAVYFAALNPGDTILAMSLAHGGHLTHGHKVNFSGRLFKVVSYGVGRDTGRIDYDEVARLAKEHRPKLIVVGASAYPRTLEFERFRAIADDTGAQMMVDMAHIAGLVAGGVHPSPVKWAEFVTSTTHKTLRGPRSGMVLCRKGFAEALDRQVFPGLQGGPLMHVIAAKAVCFHEASAPAFKAYAAQVVKNASTLAGALMKGGFELVSGGTDNHLMLVNLAPKGLTGRDAAIALDKAGLVVNKNAVPFDPKPPMVTSGIRIGTPAVTTRGMGESEMETIGAWIVEVLRNGGDEAVLKRIRAEVESLAGAFPPP